MAKATTRELYCAPSLLAFLASKERKILGTMPEVVVHPAADLITSYVEQGISVHTGKLWSIQVLDNSVSKGSHAWACTPEMNGLSGWKLYSGGYRMDLASSSLWRMHCRCLEKIPSSPASRWYLRHIADCALSSTYWQNQTKVRLVLMTLQTGRLPWNRCSLGKQTLASSRQSGKQTQSRVLYRFQNLTSHMHITAAVSGNPRWAHLRMPPHQRRETRDA